MLSSKNFASMATWRNDFSSVLSPQMFRWRTWFLDLVPRSLVEDHVKKVLRHCGGKTRHVIWKLNFARDSWNCVVVRSHGADRVCRLSLDHRNFTRIYVDESLNPWIRVEQGTEYNLWQTYQVRKFNFFVWLNCEEWCECCLLLELWRVQFILCKAFSNSRVYSNKYFHWGSSFRSVSLKLVKPFLSYL